MVNLAVNCLVYKQTVELTEKVKQQTIIYFFSIDEKRCKNSNVSAARGNKLLLPNALRKDSDQWTLRLAGKFFLVLGNFSLLSYPAAMRFFSPKIILAMSGMKAK